MNAKPISEIDKNGCGPIALLGFGSFFLLLGLIVFWFTFVGPVIELMSARAWPSSVGTIISARVAAHHGESTSYSAEFVYEYHVGGVRFENDRYNFFNISGSKKAARKRVQRFPVGSQTDIFYDPGDPANSIMSRRAGWGLAFGLVPLLFAIVGGVIICGVTILGWGSPRRQMLNELESQSPANSNSSSTAVFAPDVNFEGPQKLKSESSKWVALLVVAIICLVWNGIVSLFAKEVVEDGFPLLTTLFLTPFVLVGLCLIGGVVYCFLTMFNPFVEIALSNGVVGLGHDVDLAWEAKGRASWIRNLTITVQGTEAATYRQGTDTRTDTEIFEKIQVTVATKPGNIAFGVANVNIPRTTMHSFQSDNNEIKWSVVVHGEIPFWPDVNQNMVFRVKP